MNSERGFQHRRAERFQRLNEGAVEDVHRVAPPEHAEHGLDRFARLEVAQDPASLNRGVAAARSVALGKRMVLQERLGETTRILRPITHVTSTGLPGKSTLSRSLPEAERPRKDVREVLHEPRPEAGAQRTLEGVGSMPSLGWRVNLRGPLSVVGQRRFIRGSL